MKTQISRWLTIALITMLNPSWGNATDLNSSHHLVLAEETQTTLSVRDAQGTLLTTLASGIVDKNVQLATANGDDLPKSIAVYHDKQIQGYSVEGQATFSLPVTVSGRVVQG